MKPVSRYNIYRQATLLPAAPILDSGFSRSGNLGGFRGRAEGGPALNIVRGGGGEAIALDNAGSEMGAKYQFEESMAVLRVPKSVYIR